MNSFARRLVDRAKNRLDGHLWWRLVGRRTQHEIRRLVTAQAEKEERLGHEGSRIGATAKGSRIFQPQIDDPLPGSVAKRNHPLVCTGVEVDGREAHVRRL